MNGRHCAMRVHLKGVHRVHRRLVNGEIRTHWYAWRGGPRLTGKPGSPEFVQSYTEAHAARKKPAEGRVSTLIAEFKTSSEYLGLSDATKRAYASYVKMIEAEFGDMPIEALSDPRVRGEFKAWRDRMAAHPRKADYAWTTLARVLSVAKNRGRIPVNPCERGGRLYQADRTDRLWTRARPRAPALGSLAGDATDRATRSGDRPAPRRPVTTALVGLRWEAYSPSPIQNWAGRNRADCMRRSVVARWC